MEKLDAAEIPCRSHDGDIAARIFITPEIDHKGPISTAPLVRVSSEKASEYGETEVQLRETSSYEYQLDRGSDLRDLRLRCSLARRRRNLGKGQTDAGRIETGNYCGTLLLEIVDGSAETQDKKPLATGLVAVRSLKLDYRSEYRGMLRALSEELAAVIVDARSSAKLVLRSNFEERSETGWFQVQLELLREILETPEFLAAIQRILTYPHETLEQELREIDINSPFKWTPQAVHTLISSPIRRKVPEEHVLRHSGLTNVASTVSVMRKIPTLDTPENRFAKYVLSDFHAFLVRAGHAFETTLGNWTVPAGLAHRLAAVIEQWLFRGFFREVGLLDVMPLGSPVLQRKAGYRELLHWWLRFRTAAELSWEGGEDLFRAGQRNVADLYEYWLFFVLLSWFRKKFASDLALRIEDLIDGLTDGSPNLRLKKHTQLGPFSGTFGSSPRRLSAMFCYNRQFEVTQARHEGGSWTRRMHPDYTLSFWPADFSPEEAETRELLVHVHFDAKYRVEDVSRLFGDRMQDDADEEEDNNPGNYKRQDLLKMHAYRDAIKRSEGAYILYPGDQQCRDSQHDPAKSGCDRWPHTIWGFHEILPGLGGFAIAPDELGNPQGMDLLEKFLDEIIDHLANRTTARERVTYHIAEAYDVHEDPVSYGGLSLSESDICWPSYRALPPAEEMVLAAWYRNERQLALAEDENGFTYVRLGRRGGALHVHPNLARVRHIMLRTERAIIAPGLLLLRELGFRIFTRLQLRTELQNHARGRGVAAWEADAGTEDEEYIYALFRTRRDPVYGSQQWAGDRVMDLIESFETDLRNKPVGNVSRTSPYPRILPLRDLLKTRK